MSNSKEVSKAPKFEWRESQLDLPRELDLIDFELIRMVNAFKSLMQTDARFTPLPFRGLIEEVRCCLHKSRKMSLGQPKLVLSFLEQDTWETSLLEMHGLIDGIGEIIPDL